MRIFKNRAFGRFARKVRLGDQALREAISEIERGLVHADLAGGVFKQRIARGGGGKSGGFRTIVLFRSRERAVFVYGFEKSDQDNISAYELREFRRLADTVLSYSDAEMDGAVRAGVFAEVKG